MEHFYLTIFYQYLFLKLGLFFVELLALAFKSSFELLFGFGFLFFLLPFFEFLLFFNGSGGENKYFIQLGSFGGCRWLFEFVFVVGIDIVICGPRGFELAIINYILVAIWYLDDEILLVDG